MGYTHYWGTARLTAEDKQGYVLALPSLTDIIESHREILCHEYDTPHIAPRITEKLIQFNGRGDAGHETFMFFNSKVQGSYNAFDGRRVMPREGFCKTARKPYDIAVCECLLVLKAYMPNLDVSSDGFSGILNDPQLDGLWPEAMNNVTKYGLHYRTKVSNERAPYCDMVPCLF